jgi:hypothetical protein
MSTERTTPVFPYHKEATADSDVLEELAEGITYQDMAAPPTPETNPYH